MKHIVRSCGDDCYFTFDPDQADRISHYEWDGGLGHTTESIFRTKGGRYFQQICYPDETVYEHLNIFQAVDHYIISLDGAATEEDLRKVFGEEFQCREG